VLTRLIGKIDLAQLLACQAALIEVAAGRHPQALAVWVRELIATHCEPQLEHDERTAQDKRYLQTATTTTARSSHQLRQAPSCSRPPTPRAC